MYYMVTSDPQMYFAGSSSGHHYYFMSYPTAFQQYSKPNSKISMQSCYGLQCCEIIHFGLLPKTTIPVKD